MLASVPTGARFVLLDAAVTEVDIAPSAVGLPLTWRCGPAGRDLGDESYAQRVHAFRGVGRRPLSPTHVRATRVGMAGGGDLSLSWVRRTRSGGDAWDSTDVPLGEEAERYEIDILNGATVVRTLAATTPQVAYTAAQQIADFGSTQAQLQVAVYQTSAFGRGSPET